MTRWSPTLRGVTLAILILVAIPAYSTGGRPAGAGAVAANGESAIDTRPFAAFVANHGQIGNEEVRLYFDGGNLRIGFANRTVLYDLRTDAGGAPPRGSRTRPPARKP